MNQDAKTTYAQSSDIKSRTYLEYRKDMKQKAIAELEILPWLSDKVRSFDKKAVVEKFGGDKSIWFLRNGKITREPDFVIKNSTSSVKYIEFQYAKKELLAYDFKISKITPKDRKFKKPLPKADTQILYIIKPTCQFALLEPAWIAENSKKTVAAAWGNAPVFRMDSKKFKKKFQPDTALIKVCEMIDKKKAILDFQHDLLAKEKERFSNLLQQVIDEDKLLNILPKTLEGFFEVCFILSHLDKTPANSSLWLVYLLSLLTPSLNSYDLFRLIYSLDFLYPRVELKQNELVSLVEGIDKIKSMIKDFARQDGSFISDKTLAPLEETRHILFVINILEDLIQDLIFYYPDTGKLKPIKRIYQTVPDIDKTCDFIFGKRSS